MTIALSTFSLVEPVDAVIAPVRQPDQPDADVARAAGGDVRAFERLYAANAGRVHALVRRMLTPAEADETVQDVFVRAWSKLGTFRGESAFSTWLHRLAVNVCLARRQTASRDRRRFLEDDTALVAAPAPRRTPELSIDVESALARLPDGMRRVLVLHDIEGFTHEEIAEQFGIAIGTSKSQLHRARLALRPMLER